MKRFFGILGLVVLLSLILTPCAVLADTPPDPPATPAMTVVVDVNGDNTSATVNANGSGSTISVNGTSLNNLTNINQLSFLAVIESNDIANLQTKLDGLITAYNKSVPLTQKEIDDLQQTMNLLSTATAKLITAQGTMGQAIDNNEGATRQSLAGLNQSLVSLQKSLDAIYAEADTLKTKIDTNQADVTGEQDKFTTAFNTFTSDTKANYGILVNAVNNLNEQASEQKARTDTVMKIAIIASAIPVISLVFAIIIFVKGLSVKR